MAKYQRRREVVDAFQWDGNAKVGYWPEWAQLAAGERRLVYFTSRGHPRLRVHALGGPLDACRDHWIILDGNGNLTHRTPADFAANYAAEGMPMHRPTHVLVDFGNGKKIDIDVANILLKDGECLRVECHENGPLCGGVKYDPLECTNGG